jgi:copper(I)-binding protein
MKKFLILLNGVLLLLIFGVAVFWHPEPDRTPLPGTHAARVGSDVVVDADLLSQPQSATRAAIAQAGLGSAQQLEVRDAYVRLMPPSLRTTAAYMTLHNTGSREVQVVAAACAAVTATELHEHINDDGVMRMRPVKAIQIPPQGEIRLQPGGYHIMLIDMKAPLQEGELLAITLMVADGSSLEVVAPVKRVMIDLER